MSEQSTAQLNAQLNLCCKIKDRLELKLDQGVMTTRGSIILSQRIQQLILKHGFSPQNWPIQNRSQTDREQILINEFIRLSIDPKTSTPHHLELCHCRKISAETVSQAIKSGCHTVKQVSQATRAGTGCGTCFPQILALLDQLTHTSSSNT